MRALRRAAALLPVLLLAGAVPAFSSTQAPARSRLADIAALPKNAVAYQRQKAIANARYARWAKRHGVATAAPRTAVSGTLNQPGLDSSAPANADTPPDTTGAIGPSNYVEMVNSEIGVWSSSDLSAAPTTLDQATFFADPTASTCDGQIEWDQEGQRWLYSGLNCNANPGSENLYVGFSKGTSPLPLDSSNWCQYQIPTGSNLEDYDKLGHDNTQIIIGANEFPDNSNGGPLGKIFVLPKPAPGTLGTCPGSPPQVANGLITLTAPDAFTPVPANIADSSATGYVVATDTNSFSRLDVYDITPSTTSGTVSPTTVVSVPAYSLPAAVPQPGAPGDVLDSLDGRLTQAVAVTDPTTGQEGIWTQHTVAGAGGGPSVERWYELTPGAATPTQVGTVHGPNGSFAFAGAISPSTDGTDAALFYNSGSSTQLADFRVADRHRYTQSGSMGEDIQLAQSAFADEDFSCPSVSGSPFPCRWGDYTGATPDPSSPNLVWGSGELTTIAPDANNDQQWGTQNAAVDVTPAATYPLQVEPNAGTGSGSVTSGDGFISCPGTCSHVYAYNTPVELTATATPGTHSHFAGWSGDCSGTGVCDLPMGGPQSVTATFALDPETLTLTKAGNGSGTVTSSPAGVTCGSTCSHDFDYGTVVHLTPAPATGSSFAGWSGACSGTGSCDVSMTQASAVTATFSLIPETLTVSKAGSGSGTVASTIAGIDCGATCSHAFDYGTSVTLTASPATGSTFNGWSGACSGLGDCTVPMTAAGSVTATFALIPETLVVTKFGSGSGTVSSTVPGISCGTTCTHAFDYGTSVTLTASPDAGSTFTGWSGACSGSGKCTVPLTGVTFVTATFNKLACVVPRLKGKTLAAAKRALKSAHCGVGKVTKKSSARVKKGQVISQTPAPRKHLAVGTPISLVVSKGKR